MSIEHETYGGTCMVDECSKGDACKYFCMADLCTKFLQDVKRCHKASSRGKFWVVEEKLDDLECLLEDALEYTYEYKGRRMKSCSTKKGIRCLQKACLHLRDKFEEEFGFDESNDDEDEEWSYPMGVSTSQGKGVQVGRVSQRSHQEPTDTPKPTSNIPPNGKILHHTHPNNQHDDENMYKSNVFASNGLNFENLACKSNQISVQSTLREPFVVVKAIIFASFFDLLGKHEITNSMHASTHQDRAENEQKSEQESHLEYPKLENDPKTKSEGLDSNFDVMQQTPWFFHFAMQAPISKPNEGMFNDFEAYFSQMEDRTYFPECQQELAEMQGIDSEYFEVFMEFLATENDHENAQIEEEFIDLFVLPSNLDF
ncbi:hypothetical protein L7F22_035176 [Adiantum nelumboides]|nr:hypothetical protein [Adiantum nelumboides]